MTSVSDERTLCPSSSTSPVARVPGVRSSIRLKMRRKVVLPQPDGAISAVIRRARTDNAASCSAWEIAVEEVDVAGIQLDLGIAVLHGPGGGFGLHSDGNHCPIGAA